MSPSRTSEQPAMIQEYAKNARMGVSRHPTWTGVDQHGATVHIYPARDFPCEEVEARSTSSVCAVAGRF
eukprot:4796337-Amphidinium_carterae.1